MSTPIFLFVCIILALQSFTFVEGKQLLKFPSDNFIPVDRNKDNILNVPFIPWERKEYSALQVYDAVEDLGKRIRVSLFRKVKNWLQNIFGKEDYSSFNSTMQVEVPKLVIDKCIFDINHKKKAKTASLRGHHKVFEQDKTRQEVEQYMKMYYTCIFVKMNKTREEEFETLPVPALQKRKKRKTKKSDKEDETIRDNANKKSDDKSKTKKISNIDGGSTSTKLGDKTTQTGRKRKGKKNESSFKPGRYLTKGWKWFKSLAWGWIAMIVICIKIIIVTCCAICWKCLQCCIKSVKMRHKAKTSKSVKQPETLCSSNSPLVPMDNMLDREPPKCLRTFSDYDSRYDVTEDDYV